LLLLDVFENIFKIMYMNTLLSCLILCQHAFLKSFWALLSISVSRLEHGYLAWSSAYLHEYFGSTIYSPLTAEEQERMKKDGYIPNWMYEFSSLPNLAIAVSYVCIGVALQLLRTPLSVYVLYSRSWRFLRCG
jgi:hypothetical protein